MKTAIIFYGGWKGHHPVETKELFTKVLEGDGFAVSSSDNLQDLENADELKTYDLIVPNWTMGELSKEQSDALSEAVAHGCGLGGWHGGMGDAFRNNTRYQFMTGGQFVAHPGGSQNKYTVNITVQDHPITEGLNDFEMETEQYYMHTDPGNQVLASTTFNGKVHPWIDGTVIPVVWTRRWGEGKVFYCSLGHEMKDFEVPECCEIIRRGLNWAARSEVNN